MTRSLAVLLFSSLLVTFTQTLDAATLRGSVTDPDGRPVPGARVVVTGSQPGSAEVTTDAKGEFEVADLGTGAHSVRVVMDGFAADPLRVNVAESGAHDVKIGLRVSAVTESVVVSAAQSDLPLSQSASTITVVSGAELDARQIRTVDRALSFVPGLSVARNGGALNLASLFTRGGESDFTLVLIDGMRANAFGGGIDLSQLPLVDVDRIEVVRGPQSAVFGSDAIGGVVQIVTRQRTQDRVEGLVEGGTLSTMRARVGASGGRAAYSWHGAVEHNQSNGFTGIAPATKTRVSNDDGKADQVGFGAGWRGASGAGVRATTQFSFTERGFPGPFGSNPIGAYTAIDRVSRGKNHRKQAGLDWMQPWGGASSRVRQHTSVTVADFTSDFTSSFGPSTSTSRRVSVRSQVDAALRPSAGVSAGIEVLRERAGSTYITGTARGRQIPVERWIAGYFAEARLAPTARLSMAGGVRLEDISRDALQADPFAFTPRPALARDSVLSTNPRVSAAYLAHGSATGNATRLRASAGTGIRPPDAFELAFTDNPGLKPERSRSVDAGVQQTLANGRGVVEATTFVNNYDDLIVSIGRSFRNASQFRTDNVSNARSRGLEFAAGARPAAGFDVRATYTFLHTEILSVDRAAGQAPSPYNVGEQLIRRPRHQGSLAASFTQSRVSAFADAVFRGTVRDVEPSYGAFGGVFTAQGYTSVNLGGAIRATRNLEAFARVENVGATRYEEAFGFPAPGRIAIVGVRVAAGR